MPNPSIKDSLASKEKAGKSQEFKKPEEEATHLNTEAEHEDKGSIQPLTAEIPAQETKKNPPKEENPPAPPRPLQSEMEKTLEQMNELLGISAEDNQRVRKEANFSKVPQEEPPKAVPQESNPKDSAPPKNAPKQAKPEEGAKKRKAAKKQPPLLPPASIPQD